jgi:site-specific DNA-methyltransferase (adenine-specific)
MDCLDGLQLLDDNSVDSIVTDPPYELGFMGKKWDMTGIAYNIELWRECLRVLKPGGHLLAFGGTRTYHRMVCAIEDAGFEIRDQMQWIYGSGFPKSHNISKAIDKKAGAERKVVGLTSSPNGNVGGYQGERYKEKRQTRFGVVQDQPEKSIPSTEEAKQWDGWGTCLKPANEPIVVARKPISEKTIADNVLKWGTGGINIDDCRIEFAENDDKRIGKGYAHNAKAGLNIGEHKDNANGQEQILHNPQGRFPANVIIDEEAGKLLDEQSGILKSGKHTEKEKNRKAKGMFAGGIANENNWYGDSGGASRFFKDCSYDKEEISWLRLQRYAQFVKENLLTMCAIIEITVPESAMQSLNVLKEILVNYAESQLKTIDMDTVLKNVIILQSQEDSQLNNMIIRFMKEMLNVLKKKDESSIKQMMNIGKKLEQELKHTAMEKLKCNHVRYVEIQLLISIMTITQNLLNTDGYAESVTSIYMLSNAEVGEKDYQLASRFKYCAKASKKERGEGNNHPTVKPLSLIKYLITLVTPPNGICLDPFEGSGTHALACKELGFRYIGFEMNEDYMQIIESRLNVR